MYVRPDTVWAVKTVALSRRTVFYVIAIVLLILGFVDLAVLRYEGHGVNGLQVSMWGVAALIWGAKTELLQRGQGG